MVRLSYKIMTFPAEVLEKVMTSCFCKSDRQNTLTGGSQKVPQTSKKISHKQELVAGIS